MAFVYFGTPSYSARVSIHFIQSMFETHSALVEKGHHTALRFVAGNGLIAQCRNEIVADFMANGEATHLMMIDDDISWQAQDVVRLLSHDVPVVGAAGPRKLFGGGYCFRHTGWPIESLKRDERGLVEVVGIGTGFIMIRRDAIEAMLSAYPEKRYEAESEAKSPLTPYLCALFDTILERKEEGGQRMLGEDYSFCTHWRNLLGNRSRVEDGVPGDDFDCDLAAAQQRENYGFGKVLMDPDIYLEHTGMATYAGRAIEVLPHLKDESDGGEEAA